MTMTQTPPSVLGSTPRAHTAAKDLFDRTAEDYHARADTRVHDLTSLVFARRKEVVLSLLDAARVRGTLLDFGMGPGVFARDAIDRGFHFIGVDISPEMIEHARALRLPNTTYVQGDLDALEPYRGSVDAVLAVGLIDYLEDPREGLRKLASCLRDGGVLIVSFRNRNSINTGLRGIAKAMWRRFFSGLKLRPKSAFVSAVHEKSFTFAQLRSILSDVGMTDFRVGYHNLTPGVFVNVSLPRRLWTFWRRVDPKVAKPPVRWACDAGVVSCRRRF
jgi:SAM-dependent methyltransferase